jgi:hypothetical protein
MNTAQSNRPAPRLPSSASVAVPLTLMVSPTDQHGESGSGHGAGELITGTGAALSASMFSVTVSVRPLVLWTRSLTWY